MQRRKLLIGMGGLAAGSAAAIGTGAFTSVNAERAFEFDVVQDQDALLALGPCEGSSNSEYLVENGTGDPESDGYTGGTIAIGTDDPQVTGDGVNNEAITVILDIFSLKNQGPNAVWVDVDAHAPGNMDEGGNTRMMYRLGDDAETNAGPNYNHPEYGADVYQFGGAEKNNPVLGPGEKLCVGVRFDTHEHTGSISGEDVRTIEISAYEPGLPE